MKREPPPARATEQVRRVERRDSKSVPQTTHRRSARVEVSSVLSDWPAVSPTIVLDRPPETDAAVLALLQEIRDELQAQRRELRQLRRDVSRLAPPRSDGAVLAAIAAAVDTRVFSAHELIAHAAIDPALAAALSEAGLASAHDVGTWLRGVAGRAIGGIHVARVARDERGTVWALVAADADGNLHPVAGVTRRRDA